jgi:hypothetical protein
MRLLHEITTKKMPKQKTPFDIASKRVTNNYSQYINSFFFIGSIPFLPFQFAFPTIA